jgi:hypothetical protein
MCTCVRRGVPSQSSPQFNKALQIHGACLQLGTARAALMRPKKTRTRKTKVEVPDGVQENSGGIISLHVYI